MAPLRESFEHQSLLHYLWEVDWKVVSRRQEMNSEPANFQFRIFFFCSKHMAVSEDWNLNWLIGPYHLQNWTPLTTWQNFFKFYQQTLETKPLINFNPDRVQLSIKGWHRLLDFGQCKPEAGSHNAFSWRPAVPVSLYRRSVLQVKTRSAMSRFLYGAETWPRNNSLASRLLPQTGFSTLPRRQWERVPAEPCIPTHSNAKGALVWLPPAYPRSPQTAYPEFWPPTTLVGDVPEVSLTPTGLV